MCITVLIVTAVTAVFALRLVRTRQAHRTPRTAIGGTRNPHAFAAFEQGRASRQAPLSEARLVTAIDHFQEAVGADPNFAQAWAALAETYVALNSIGIRDPESLGPSAISAANRAAFLDPNLASSHLARAEAEASFNWNWPVATAELQKALALDPTLVATYQWQAFAFAAQGNLPAARRHLVQALALNSSAYGPETLNLRATLAHYFLYAGEPAASAEQLRQLCLGDPSACKRLWLAEALEADHQTREAAKQFHFAAQANSSQQSYALAREGRALALSGDIGRARAALTRLKSSPGPNNYIDPYGLSLLLAALGDSDEAHRQLLAAIAQHSPAATFYRVDPALQSAQQTTPVHPHNSPVLSSINPRDAR